MTLINPTISVYAAACYRTGDNKHIQRLQNEMFMFICSLIHGLSATNMNDGLLRAVGMLVKERKDGSLPERSADMIILLTDGMPNHGELSHI